MTKTSFARLAAVAALFVSAWALAAGPSVHDVYAAVQAGRVAEAETMMQQVLAEHPQSAEAHYVMAEVEYRAGRLDRARGELSTAERINPALPFASPRSVAELKTGLANNGRVRSSAVTGAGSSGGRGFPWLLLIGLVLVVVLVVRLLSNRQPPVVVQPPYGAPGYGPGVGPGGPVPMGGPGYGYGGPGMMGQGSGLMGSVASGLAVGAGIVAGEALARNLFEPGHPNYVPPTQDTYTDPNADLGGDNFGVSDGGSDWGDGGGFSGGGGGDDWS